VGAQASTAISDASGQFLFRDVPQGAYRITVQAPGYLPSAYGQRRPDGPARAVRLSAGMRRVDVTIEVWRPGAVEGMLRDEHGDAIVGASVRALQRVSRTTGPQFVPVLAATTDDRGLYRLAPLAPGQYVVLAPSSTVSLPTTAAARLAEAFTRIATSGRSGDGGAVVENMLASSALISPEGISIDGTVVQVSATPAQVLGPTTPLPAPNGVMDVYRSTFYAGAASLLRASLVEIRSGETRSGVDISLELTRGFKVSGFLAMPDAGLGDLIIRLLPSDSTSVATHVSFETSMTMSRGDGSFSLLGVPPGDYLLTVLRFGRPPSPNAGEQGAFSQRTLWAELPVSVTDRDVAGLVVPVAFGARVEGRVIFEGAPATPEVVRRTAVGLTPVDGRTFGNASAFLPLGAEGSFATLAYPPGRYFVTVRTPGSGWVVKSIGAGGNTSVYEPLVLEGNDIRHLVVTLTSRVATLSGTVRTASGGADAMVLLMPADLERWIVNGLPAMVLRAAHTDPNGLFEIGDLAPGAYLAVAVDSTTDVDTRSAAAVRSLARFAAAVTLPEGGGRAVSLTLAPMSR
jgi:hypothetical protein